MVSSLSENLRCQAPLWLSCCPFGLCRDLLKTANGLNDRCRSWAVASVGGHHNPIAFLSEWSRPTGRVRVLRLSSPTSLGQGIASGQPNVGRSKQTQKKVWMSKTAALIPK